MGKVITIGLDIAKSVFQVHGVDDAGAVVIRKRVDVNFGGRRRLPVSLLYQGICLRFHKGGVVARYEPAFDVQRDNAQRQSLWSIACFP
jgi:hypothetical protein